MAQAKLLVTITDPQFFQDAQNKRESIRVWDIPKYVPHWIENWDSQNQQGKVWIKVTKIPANGSVDVWLYYGNPTAPDNSSKDAVISIFDDFDTLNTNIWDVSGLASASVSNSQLITTANANTWTNWDSAAIANIYIDGDFYLEAKVSYNHNTSDLSHIYLEVEDSSGNKAYGGLNDAWAREQPVYNVNVAGTGTSSGKVSDTGTIIIKIYRSGSTVTVELNGDVTIKQSGTISGTITKIRLVNQRYGTYAGRTAYWYYIKGTNIRTSQYQYPTITIGAEESSDINGWAYRRKITISNPNNYDLIDFQVAINLNSNNFDFTKANADGSDIRFLLDSTYTQPINYYIQTWDTTTPKAEIYVAIDEADPDFYIEVNPYYTTDASDSSVLNLPDDTSHVSLKSVNRIVV